MQKKISAALLIFACFATFAGFAEGTTPNMEAGFFFNLFPMFEYTTQAKATAISDEALGEYYNKPTFGSGGFYFKTGPITAIGIMEFQQDIWSKLNKQSIINLPDSETGWIPDVMGLGTFYPNVGYVDYVTEGARLSLGRRKIHEGPSTYSLGLSSYNPYYDHVAASLAVPVGAGKLGYDYVAVGMQRWWNDTSEVGDGTQPKYFFYHRASWTGAYFTIGINEYNLIAGTTPDFQDWGPFLFYHNLFNNHQNVMAGIDFEWKPIESASLYGQFVMDDFQLPGEGGNPTAMGFSLGTQWNIMPREPVSGAKYYDSDYTYYVKNQPKKGGLTLKTEGYLMSRYLYRRGTSVLSEGFTAQYQVMTNWLTGRRDVVTPFLATPLAPDTFLARLALEWAALPWEASFAFEYRLAGSESTVKDWSTVDDVNWLWPSSPTTELSFKLDGKYRLGAASMATAGVILVLDEGSPAVTLNAGFAHQFAAGKGPTFQVGR
ncbi:MAG TPA: hypothetical protein VN445_04800 [Rectinemataceae bacterium]|nr:hypothetical protein [Rectinemataceae bacterium]